MVAVAVGQVSSDVVTGTVVVSICIDDAVVSIATCTGIGGDSSKLFVIVPVIGVAQSVNFIDVQGLTKPIKRQLCIYMLYCQ